MNITHGTVNVDVLRGKVDEENEIWGHRGDDDIRGGQLDDAIIGGKGDDNLWGDRGNDKIIGDSGDDTLWGSVDNDRIFGGVGNDVLYGGKNDDALHGGKDNDMLNGNSGDDAMIGGLGDDVLMGQSGSDVMFGGGGSDTLMAGSGNDFVMASSGGDSYSGGSGFDTLDFSRMVGKVDIDLGHHWARVGSGKAIADSFVAGFEQVIGSDAGNHFMGDRNDTAFIGGKGDDWFRGKLGADVLTGGDGADTFAWLKKDLADGSVDTVTDFQVGVDKLDVSDFLKGHSSYGDVLKVSNDGQDTMLQGLVKGQWVDVVQLQGVEANTLADLGILV